MAAEHVDSRSSIARVNRCSLLFCCHIVTRHAYSDGSLEKLYRSNVTNPRTIVLAGLEILGKQRHIFYWNPDAVPGMTRFGSQARTCSAVRRCCTEATGTKMLRSRHAPSSPLGAALAVVRLFSGRHETRCTHDHLGPLLAAGLCAVCRNPRLHLWCFALHGRRRSGPAGGRGLVYCGGHTGGPQGQ